MIWFKGRLVRSSNLAAWSVAGLQVLIVSTKFILISDATHAKINCVCYSYCSESEVICLELLVKLVPEGFIELLRYLFSARFAP